MPTYTNVRQVAITDSKETASARADELNANNITGPIAVHLATRVGCRTASGSKSTQYEMRACIKLTTFLRRRARK